MDYTVLLFGFLFGFAMQYANLNKFNTISGMATLEDYTMAKTMGFAIGLGAIIIALDVGLGFANYHVKPLIPIANSVGGLIFGVGMAILGYCPGTLPISLGQGALDALVGIIGGLFGGWIFTINYESIAPYFGTNYGPISLYSLLEGKPIVFYALTILFGCSLMYIAFKLDDLEGRKNKKWLITGLAFALINGIMLLNVVFSRPIGASTAYPYLADIISNDVNNTYFKMISGPGSWELMFLVGAFFAGLLPALYNKSYRLSFIQERWQHYFGSNLWKRLIWAFLGGFLLIFGARVAGGCASGHILSGVMQMGIGSLVFALFTFIAFIITGKYFYKSSFGK
ncbi:MAG: transporter [Bacteroidetes bacterium MedPE-SWsnd-G2]|nr:MAG: transporter [Bacteroidetes bacterium MedPE-SWsnd-G2]